MAFGLPSRKHRELLKHQRNIGCDPVLVLASLHLYQKNLETNDLGYYIVQTAINTIETLTE